MQSKLRLENLEIASLLKYSILSVIIGCSFAFAFEFEVE